MELDELLKALLRRWWILVLILGLGILGAWGYLKLRNMTTAQASVAVLETALTKPMAGGMQAQVSYSTVVESRTLAQKVVDKLGLPLSAKEVQGRLSVKISPSLIPSLGSPLYLVRAKDRDGQVAVNIADTAVEEAATLFADLNAVGNKDIETVFRQELERSRQAVTDARNELIEFQRVNGVYDLPLQLQTEAAMVYQIKQSKLLLTSPEAAMANAKIAMMQGVTDGPPLKELEEGLARETAEMDRLSKLEPELGQHTFDQQLAQSMVAQLESRLADLRLAQTPGSETEAIIKTVEAELSQARQRLAKTKEGLEGFQSSNDTGTGRLQQQVALVYQIRQQLLNVQLARAQEDSVNAARGRTIDEMGKALETQYTDVQKVIDQETKELERLAGLNVRYQDLLFDLQQAESRVRQEQQQVVALVASLLVPPSAQVRTVDTAAPMSGLRWMVAVYAISALLGLFVGISLIYVLGYFDRTPRSSEEAGKLMGAPVLTSIPRQR